MALIAATSVVLNAVLTVAFTPWFGITGAATASFIAYGGLAAGMVWLLTQAVDHVPLRRSLRPLGRDDWIVTMILSAAHRLHLTP
jgi:O-antigen/teichoic acid export membrane protein